jgi:FAD/FMN-containing dehydrogenase
MSSSSSRQYLYERLCEIVGSNNVSYSEYDLIEYGRDWSPIPSSTVYKPDFIVVPESRDQVVELVKLANETKTPLIPRGGGTGLSLGALAVKGGIIVDMKGMDKLIDIDEDNLTVTTQPGIVIETLNKKLEKKGLMYIHQPASKFSATVGGAISTNGLGNFAVKYGRAGDSVLSLEVVLPRGDVVRTAPNVYSTSGYDLTKLFIGAEGTLGIITEATVKVAPLPECRSLITFSFDDMETAIGALYKILYSGLSPELLVLNDYARFKSNIQSYYKEKYGYAPEVKEGTSAIIVGLAGSEKIVKFEEEVLHEIFVSSGGKMVSDEVTKCWWNYRYVADVNPWHYPDRRFMSLDACVPISKLLKFYQIYIHLIKKNNLMIYGANITPVNSPIDIVASWSVYVDSENLDECTRFDYFTNELANEAMRLGGTISSYYGVGFRNTIKYLPIEHGHALEVMKEIKKLLDPNNIMNPYKKIPLNGG